MAFRSTRFLAAAMTLRWRVMARRIPAPRPEAPATSPPLTRVDKSPPSTPDPAPDAPEGAGPPLELSASKAALNDSTISRSSRSSSARGSSPSSSCAAAPSMAAAEHSRRAPRRDVVRVQQRVPQRRVPQEHEAILLPRDEDPSVLREADAGPRPPSSRAAPVSTAVAVSSPLELLGVHRPPRAIDQLVREEPSHVPPQVRREGDVARHVEAAVEVRVRGPDARQPQEVGGVPEPELAGQGVGRPRGGRGVVGPRGVVEADSGAAGATELAEVGQGHRGGGSVGVCGLFAGSLGRVALGGVEGLVEGGQVGRGGGGVQRVDGVVLLEPSFVVAVLQVVPHVASPLAPGAGGISLLRISGGVVGRVDGRVGPLPLGPPAKLVVVIVVIATPLAQLELVLPLVVALPPPPSVAAFAPLPLFLAVVLVALLVAAALVSAQVVSVARDLPLVERAVVEQHHGLARVDVREVVRAVAVQDVASHPARAAAVVAAAAAATREEAGEVPSRAHVQQHHGADVRDAPSHSFPAVVVVVLHPVPSPPRLSPLVVVVVVIGPVLVGDRDPRPPQNLPQPPPSQARSHLIRDAVGAEHVAQDPSRGHGVGVRSDEEEGPPGHGGPRPSSRSRTAVEAAVVEGDAPSASPAAAAVAEEGRVAQVPLVLLEDHGR
ncbi:hypothetical protein ACHAWF_009494 [Thalassiosira exigua]